MKRRYYGKSKYQQSKREQRETQRRRAVEQLQAALQERLLELDQREGKENLMLLMDWSHHRFLEELELFPSRLELSLPDEAMDQLDKLRREDITRPGKLWLAFRGFRPLVGYLGTHKAKTKVNGMIVQLYVQTLEDSAKNAISFYHSQQIPVPVEELLFAEFFDIKTYVLGGLHGVYSAYSTPKEITKLLQPLLSIPPKEEYPLAQSMKRHFVIHVGGTNTGKTYGSILKLKQASSGYYLAPLRLLALEIQEDLRSEGVDCGLLTGEEEDLSPSNTHIASTVEKGSLSQKVELAVLDECQMIADPDRGYAWTRAILGCPAQEIHCCVAPEGLDILCKVISYSGSPYVVEDHQRLVPLHYVNSPIPLEDAQPGDAFVAFSRREVLRIAKELGDLGKKASVIYGALPYQARKLQMEQFLSGKTKVIVATDAIGMGLNLPIQRVIFTENQKFDGVSTRKLNSPEVKQIAGRAGRYGKYPEGFVGSVTSETSVRRMFYQSSPSHNSARLGFSDEILKIDYPLSEVLKAWQKTNSPPPFVKTSVERHIKLLGMLEKTSLKLSKEQLFRAINVPFSEDKEELFQIFLQYLQQYQTRQNSPKKHEGEMLPFPEIESKHGGENSLMDFELFDKQLDLYYSFSAMFHFPYHKERLRQEKTSTAESINRLLMTSGGKK